MVEAVLKIGFQQLQLHRIALGVYDTNKAATKCYEKAGFKIIRQAKHVIMSDGTRILTIPRNNPVNAFTLGGIVRDAGLTTEQFRKLL